MRPLGDRALVARRQESLAEARHLRRTRPHLGLDGVFDVRPAAAKAALSGMLEPRDLLEIQATLVVAQRLRGNLTRMSAQYPVLAELAKAMFDLSALVVEIGRCINGQAEVSDAASPALAAVRREGRIVHDRLQNRIQDVLNNAMSKGIAQEAVLTERDGRYVIPIKADFRGQLRGIVHDVSGSGATLWIEPLSVVDLGNQYRELRLEEQREVERVLRDLSERVGAVAGPLSGNVERLAELDRLFAAVRLGEELQAYDLPPDGPEQGWIVAAPNELRLEAARHPQLTGSVVPTTLRVGGSFDAVLITGPNTGGKTVALKTAGLLTLMALAGLPVPAAAETQIPVYDSVFADIGDEQSIEQSLSTFSSHMRTIIGILDQADSTSLVLLDELGAGTDPEEGAALARAIVQNLLEQNASIIATTHHGELKVFAHEHARVSNAHVEFDTETLSPTYRLNIGLPGRSNAIAIAERLGMPEAVLANARAHVSPDQSRVDRLLDDLREERDAMAEATRTELATVAEVERLRRELAGELAEQQEGRAVQLQQAREDLEEELTQVRRLLREAARRVQPAARAGFAVPEDGSGERMRLEELAAAQQELAGAELAIKQLRTRLPVQPPGSPAPERAMPGDRVKVRGLEQPGVVASSPDERGDLEVQFGALRMRVKLDQIQELSRASTSPAPPVPVRLPPRADSPGLELDLRGQRVEEVLPRLEGYLESTFLSGLPFVRIIHGKGTGTLRRVVRDALLSSPFVSDIETAEPRAGGDGVTIAKLAI